MKKRNLIIGLVFTLAIGIGATAYAATNTSTASSQGLGLGRITNTRGYDYVTSVLKDKLGLTDADITNAKNSGKTMYDLAKEKGMTPEVFQSALYEQKAKAIDDSVTKGTITKEQGDTLKANLKTNMDSCSGNFGQMQGKGNGNGNGRGRGMMGNGQRGLNCQSPNITTK